MQKEALRVSIARFPGSNCDEDTLRFFLRANHDAFYLWHTETKMPAADLLFLPGGFAFGDREYTKATHSYTINPGVQALKSPVMEVIRNWAERGKPILGVCNGFQMLVHAGLLPGKLIQNEKGQFFCDDVDCRIDGASFFGSEKMLGSVLKVNVAHGYGRFVVTPQEHKILEENGQIFIRYHGFNPNGSFDNIAGVCNRNRTIFGMMPHPERADLQTQTLFLQALEDYVRNRG